MEQKAFSFTSQIRDEQQPYYILARIKMKLAWPNRYDLQVYTDDLPDVLYLLALAAYDYNKVGKTRPLPIGK
jgi:hypothetical protein